MKKIAGLFLVLGLLATSAYAEVAENKKFQRKNTPQGQAKGFWAKEAERSGLNQWAPSKMGNAFGNLNPVRFFKDQQDKYNARKTGSVVK